MSGYELKDIKQQHEQKNNNTDGQAELPDVVIIGNNNQTRTDRHPFDRYNLVFIILLIHGVGTLMPWNMFINAQDYFRRYKLASPTYNATATSNTQAIDEVELENLRKNFLSYLSLASQVPNVIFNGLNLLVNMGSGNLKLRVNLTLAIEALVFALTITLAVVDSSQWPVSFFYITMVSVVVLNMASGIYQNCIFGTGAKFPGTYTNAILIGSNFSGTFTSTVNLLSIWLAPEPQEAAIYYFITALFIILVCFISYNLLPYNLFFKYYDSAGQRQVSTNNLVIDELGPATDLRELDSQCKRTGTGDDVPEALRKTVDAMVPRPKEQQHDDQDTSFMGELRKKWQVFLNCWPQCLNVFLTFYVTLALFPAVLANVQQVQGHFSDKYFTSFACFFIFNVFAMIGNLISGWTTWPGKQHVWIPVVARLIFVPFFLFCNFNPQARHWPVLISNDWIFIVGNVLFAASSGYLSSLCMMFASSGLSADEAPKAGMLAAFFLVFGIFLGVNSSFFLTWIVERG